MDKQETGEAIAKRLELEEKIRKRIAQELMDLHDKSARVVQPGLYLAATTLDPSLRGGFAELEDE